MLRVTRAIEFSTSLRYRLPGLTPEQCLRRFGPEARQHGHNYRLEITLRGEPDPETGMVFNLSELKAIAEREVLARFDHRDLNADGPWFEKQLPTPENFARLIFEILREALPPGMLDRIRLQQDAGLWVDVIGPEP